MVAALNGYRLHHSLALEAEFNFMCDSHLVCIQSDDGKYQTQAIQIAGRQRACKYIAFVAQSVDFDPNSMSEVIYVYDFACFILVDFVSLARLIRTTYNTYNE
jgi:Domain of unknown function (DUF3480)